MKPLLIVKLGSTLPHLQAARGDFDVWFARALGADGRTVSVIDARAGAALPEPQEIAGALLTGSHEMVSDRAGWSETAARWTRRLLEAGTPTLGVCFGHQLLAWAAGGDVADNPRGREVGTVTVELTGAAEADPLLAGLENPLAVQTCHVQSVRRLPAGATILASNDHDPHHAFRLGRCAWGVQFHPEFDRQIMRAYIAHHRGPLGDQGADPDRLRDGAAETPAAASVLGRFADYVFDPRRRGG